MLGISLLGQWRDDEAQVLEQLRHACGQDAPSPEVLAVMTRLDGLLDRFQVRRQPQRHRPHSRRHHRHGEPGDVSPRIVYFALLGIEV